MRKKILRVMETFYRIPESLPDDKIGISEWRRNTAGNNEVTLYLKSKGDVRYTVCELRAITTAKACLHEKYRKNAVTGANQLRTEAEFEEVLLNSQEVSESIELLEKGKGKIL